MIAEGEEGRNQMFRFRRVGNIQNNLVNKNIPGINVSEKNNMVECIDAEAESYVKNTTTQIVRSLNPFEFDLCLPYFEVRVRDAAEDESINVGLISKDNTNKIVIGKVNNTFGYYKGDLYLNKRKVSFGGVR